MIPAVSDSLYLKSTIFPNMLHDVVMQAPRA